MDRSIAILGYAAAALFLAAMALTLYGGVSLADAIVWNVLGSLSIFYYTLPVNAASDPALLMADLIDVFVFALIAVMLASLFFDLIRGAGTHERRARRRVRALKGHVILAPLNAFSLVLMEELKGSNAKYVVIAKSAAEAARLRARGVLTITGNPSAVETLEAAGVKSARYAVACSEDDIENTLIAISAKAANSGIRVISRLAKQENMPKLGRAGTYKLVMPEVAAGAALANAILKKVV